MVKIRQAIVVEGKYDQNTLSQLVDATIFQTRGFGVMRDKALLELLRKAARTTGLIIFTDSDGAGFCHPELPEGRASQGGRAARLHPPYPRQGKAQARARERGAAWRGGHDEGNFTRGTRERGRGFGRLRRQKSRAIRSQNLISTLRAFPEDRTVRPSARHFWRSFAFRRT